MSLLRAQQRDTQPSSLADLLASRLSRFGSVNVTADTALTHSAVWACLRLRADLISTMPVDPYRKVSVDGDVIQQPVPTPAVLVSPSTHGDGQPMDITEWLYSTQFELDRRGNAFGIITARDGNGLPARVEPVAGDNVQVVVKAGQSRITSYRIGGESYRPRDVWHERQYTIPGMHVGLSPIAYAAYSIGGYLSAQRFALDWFRNGAVPGSILKNTAKTIDSPTATAVKSRAMATLRNGEPFVVGADWTYEMVKADAATAQFLDEMNYGITDVCRFLGVPGDMIDASSTNRKSVTYANITQRNLQLLILNLGPAIVRRERALSAWLQSPRFVKFNTDAILRMDPAQRTEMILARVGGRVLAPSEARALDNLPPFTDEQITEFHKLGFLGAAINDAPTDPAPGGAQ